MLIRSIVFACCFFFAACSTNVNRQRDLIPLGFSPAQGWETNQKTGASFFKVESNFAELIEVADNREALVQRLENTHVFFQAPKNFEVRLMRIFQLGLQVYWVKVSPKKTLSTVQLRKLASTSLGCRPLNNLEFGFHFQKDNGPFDQNFVELFNLAMVDLILIQKNRPQYPKIFNADLAQANGQPSPLSALALNLLDQKNQGQIKTQGLILCLPKTAKFR